MGVEVNLYPQSGGSVSYRIESVSATVKKIHFSITVNSGHTLTHWAYSNDVTSNGGDVSIAGYATRTDFYVQQYSTSDVSSHTFSLYFDGVQPGHEDEHYSLDIIATANNAAAGNATAEPSSFADVPVGVTSRYKLLATPNQGYIFDHWERVETGATSTANPWSSSATPTEGGYYQRRYIAYFREAQTFTVTASASPEGGGKVNGVAVYTENFEEGSSSSVTLSAVPSAGYAFVRWVRTSPSSTTSNNSTITRTVSRSETWVAEFTNDPSKLISVDVVFHPDIGDHGKHGSVTIENSRSGLATYMESSQTLLIYSTTTSSSFGLFVTALSDNGCSFVKIFRSGRGTRGDVTITDEGVRTQVNVISGDRIEVYFGCGRLMYLNGNDHLVHASNGKLIFCG